MIEVLKQALEALEVSTDWDLNATGKQGKSVRAIMSLRQAIAELENSLILTSEVNISNNFKQSQRTEQLKACVYCGQLVAKEKST